MRLPQCFVGLGRRLVASTLTVLLAAPAGAAPVTFSFTGTVTDDPLGTGLTSFSGSYTFDPAAADGVASDQTGSYTSTGSEYGITVTLTGGPTASVAGSLNIGIANDFAGPVDQYTVTGLESTVEIGLFLEDSTANAFATDDLPLLPPVLNAFVWRQFRWFDTNPDAPTEILGNIETLSCTDGCSEQPVPEPGAGALLTLALAGLAWSRRRQVRPG